MDNRESESNRASPHSNGSNRGSRAGRQRAQYNNWASTISRVPTTVSRGSNTSEDRQGANDRSADNRDSYVEVGRNHSSSSNLPTIINDLSGRGRSNETTDSSRDNRNNHSHRNNNVTTNGSAAIHADSDSVARGVNTVNRTRPRRRNSYNSRGGGGGGGTARSNASTNTRNFNNSTSPVRGNNNPRHRVPPLRLRGNSPARNQDFNDLHSSLNHSPDSPEMELVFPSPYPLLNGLITEYDPLSPAHDHHLTDEEIARQLQQEEWERSNTPADLSLFPSNPRNFFFGRPPRRNPAQVRGRRLDSSFLLGNNGRDGRLSPDGYPETSGASANPFSVRGLRSGPLRLGNQFHMRHQAAQAAADLIPFIFDLFHSHGFPDAEVMNILNPDGGELATDYEALLALAEQVGEVSRGLSQADINKLPTQKHNSESASEESGAACGGEEPQCNICLTEYEEGDTKRVMPCQHEFHKDCVDQWLKTNATCPVCRSDVKLKRS